MISQVTITILPNGQPREVWFLFDSDHPNLFALNETLATDGTVYGTRIETEPAGPGRRREIAREEIIIGRKQIATVIPPKYELLPPEGSS